MSRVYLAGPINGCSDEEVFAWRLVAKCLLSCAETVNPADRDYRGIEMAEETAMQIVREDLAEIDSCDYMIAYCKRPSVGTSMEVYHFFASGRGKVVVVPPDAGASPWLVAHSHARATSIEEACGVIFKWVNGAK